MRELKDQAGVPVYFRIHFLTRTNPAFRATVPRELVFIICGQ